MRVNSALVQDTFAEAWDLEVVRLVLTAISDEVAMGGALQYVGAAGSSELGSPINAGIERPARPQETPDGRPGVIIACTMPPAKREQLIEELARRTVLATLIPTCALYDCMVPDIETTVAIDLHARTADRWRGYDLEREVGGRCVCAVPTTTGEFLYERTVTLSTSGTDGHLVCYADTACSAVQAVQAAKSAIAGVDGVAPMGYGLEQVFRELEYIPALRGRLAGSKVPDGVNSIVNLLMFGVTSKHVQRGLGAAIAAAAQVPGVQGIGAMNFGGSFGRHKYYLHRLLEQEPGSS